MRGREGEVRGLFTIPWYNLQTRLSGLLKKVAKEHVSVTDKLAKAARI